MATHREKSDPELERLLNELVILTERMEARLGEIEQGMTGTGKEPEDAV